MNGDLISRSALMQSLRNNVLVDVTSSLEEAIEEQPTAYDLDKVVEQLEEVAIEGLGITRGQFEIDKGEYLGYCSLSLYDVKEVIKSGGID